MKTKTTLPLIVSLFLLVAGCGEGARLELAVASEDPEVILRTQQVLYYRLNKAARNPFANLATGYFPDSKKLVFEFDRSAPDAESLRYLYETQGAYRVSSTDSGGEDVEWISNRDIEAAEASRSGDNGQVFVALNIESAKRLQELSNSNIGTTIVSTIDGEAFLEKKLLAPFGRYFQFDLDSETEARNLAIVLSSGVLPVEVSAYDNGEEQP